MKKTDSYYLGLDIGTDSVGYAVTDKSYKVLSFKNKAMWGAGLFDAANTCLERRGFRTARRRLDRRQARVRLLREFFEAAINEVDPKFFTRIRESQLFAEHRTDTLDNQTLFNDAAFKDTDFHGKYPTIHHLIVELMKDASKHDPRLVYIALAWLLAHRGHFLSEINIENVASLDDVTALYNELMDYMNGEAETEDGETTESSPMWEADPKAFGEILAKKASLSYKREKMLDLLWGGKKPKSEDSRFDRYEVISLLCGSDTVKPSKLFKKDEYAEMSAISLGAEDEKIETLIGELGDDGELIRKLKTLFDWAVLRDVRRGSGSISEAKIAVYEQHKADLKNLKALLMKYSPKLYKKVFQLADEKTPNYTAYVYNAKGVKKAKKETFSEWLKKELKDIKPQEEDAAFFNDMMNRLEMCAFLPKQIDGDNRVIPHQLYQVELRTILNNAAKYLPFLTVTDKYGSVAQKIETIFTFRVPYFVGPLVDPDSDKGKFAWMVRKAKGQIRPWNFKEMVDLDKSENEFISRMTNTCSYVMGEDVLPCASLLYQKYMLLNELNPLKIEGAKITTALKERIIEELFKSKRKVSLKALKKYLVDNNLAEEDDELSGIDEEIKSSLSTYHQFKKYLDKKILTEDEVEAIVLRSTCTEDTQRLVAWIKAQPFSAKLEEFDIKKIAAMKFKDFGKLSGMFLKGIVFESKETGKRGSVIEFLERENVVLMELLSERYTLREELEEINAVYSLQHPMSMEDRLNAMYVSSAVKRQIYRALDIVKTVKKVQGAAPKKIFIEMARGGAPDQKGKRTKSRVDQLREWFKAVRDEEVKAVNGELDAMGDNVHNRLQADALYLRMMQLGHCAYCGKTLPLEGLKSVANIDHIHPQSKVKDDSVINNKVLCCSTCNDKKKDMYPVPASLRQEALWTRWYKLGLMSAEKYRRLMRKDYLTDEELQGFINRQLVETRQTTKAIFTILQKMLPDTEVIAVKAGNVSDFRHEFDLPKSRAINDLHHAKDAYLNIVVGNVYHERFSRQFFKLSDNYSMKLSTLFGEKSHIENSHGLAWDGKNSIIEVKATMARNDINLTKYAFYAKGGFFDQMPKGPGESTIPRKAKLPVEYYGGYAKPAATGYLPVKFKAGKKTDIIILPVDLLDVKTITGKDEDAAIIKVAKAISAIEGKEVHVLGFPLGRKLLKVNSVLKLDGFPYVIRGKSGGGKMLLLGSLRSLSLMTEDERYVKRLESISEKMNANRNLVIDKLYDKVTEQENIALYGKLLEAVLSSKFKSMPASQAKVLKEGLPKFETLEIKEQIATLLSIVSLLKTNRAGGCDLTGVGGVAKAGVITLSSKVSNWAKSFKSAKFEFVDFSGLYESETKNLISML